MATAKDEANGLRHALAGHGPVMEAKWDGEVNEGHQLPTQAQEWPVEWIRGGAGDTRERGPPCTYRNLVLVD